MTSGIVKTATMMFGKSYFEQVFGDTEELFRNAETQLIGQKIKFDSFVGIGLSGVLVLPILARHFDVPFLALRKAGVDCHDTYGIGQYGRGTIGRNWVLIDDFVSSGRTIRVAQDRVDAGLREAGNGFRTEYMGCYGYGSSYGSSDGTFHHPNGNKVSLKSIEVDGEIQLVNAEVYKLVWTRIRNFTRKGYADPKGAAISYIRSDVYYADLVDLDELTTIAVVAEKDYRANPNRDD